MPATQPFTCTDQAVAEACGRSAAFHERLCPRQVLGVRMGIAGARALGLDVPREDKRLLVFVETDGCFVDGVTAATGASVGHRTLRLADYGRVAITAIDTTTGAAVRVAPREGVREGALGYAPDQPNRYQAQIHGYGAMPEQELLCVTPVVLTFDLPALLGRHGLRATCARCAEEILNQRERETEAGALCPACADGAYYRA